VGWSEEAIMDAAFNETRALVPEIYAGDGFSMGNVNPVDQEVAIPVNVTVIGRQEVGGTWRAGYSITYTDIKTVSMWMLPLTDSIINATVISLPDHNVSVSFSDYDQEAISAVLSNSTFVRSIKMSSYYVEDVEQMPADSPNASFAGTAFVYLKEVDGLSGVAAVWSYSSQRIVTTFNFTEQADLENAFEF
jgi:hypothetical protein